MNEAALSSINCGDTVSIDDVVGEVVSSSITNSYSAEFPKADWDGPDNDGIMIRQDNGALIFHDTEFLKAKYCRLEKL